MSKSKQLLELYELAKQFGLLAPKLSSAERKAAEKLAAKVGLPDTVYHSSPNVFSTIKPGSDELIHVATDPRVAGQRRLDMSRTPGTYNITPEEAAQMGITPEQAQGGMLYELKTRLGKPLTVSDLGDFNLSNLLKQPNVIETLDDTTKRKLTRLSIDARDLRNKAVELKEGKEQQALFDQAKVLEQQGMSILGDALESKGYGSLHYKNMVELPKEYAPIKNHLSKLYSKLNVIDTEIASAKFKNAKPSEIVKLEEAKNAIQEQIDGVTELVPDSYALFNKTPKRHITAKFDKSALESDPNAMLKNILLATGAGTAAASMMPEEAEAGITYKAGEVAKALDSLRKSGKLVPTEVLKALNYSAPSTKNEIATARAAMKNVLEHGLRERAGLMASSPNWRVNEEIVKTFHPELRDIFPISEGSRAEQIMKERGIKDASGAFYSDATDSPIIPYRGKGIAVIDDSPSLVHHEDTHAIESLLYPNMAETSLAQYFSGKRSKDLFKQSNEELAKKLSIVSKTGETEEEILKFLNSIRPEGHGESKELRKIINAQSDAFQLGDAGHFINYPKNFELTRGLEMLKDEVKVPKGSLKENRALMDEIINNPKLSKSEVNKRLAKIQENAELVPSVKKHRYVLPDKMPFAVAGAVGAGMLASPEKATATEMQDSNSPLNVGENSKIEPSPAPTPSPDYEPRKAYNRGKSFNKGYLEGSENANRILFDKNLSFDEKQQKLEEMNALGDSSIMNEYIKEKDPEQYGRLKGIEDKIDLIDPSNYFLGGWKRVIPRKFASEILPAVKKELPKVKGLLPNKTDVLSVLKGEANKEVENDVLKMLKGEN